MNFNNLQLKNVCTRRIGDNQNPNSCGRQIVIVGNRFVDSAQRPADYDRYFANVVNQTAKANSLLPAGAMKHKTLVYTNNYASTGVNDSQKFADSWVLNKDGVQQAYTNCTKPGGPVRKQPDKPGGCTTLCPG